MSIKRSKPIDRLYEEISRCDLVVVPDAPLASALNRRLERSHFGPFAITPRRLAARRRETAEDRLAFLEVIEQTDLSWKQAAYAIGNVLQCWEHQGNPNAILEYEAFDTPATRAVIDCISPLETTSRKLTDYRIDHEEYESIAVVGESQLTNLERSILPEEYTAIDRFCDESFELPPLRIFDSPAAIVDAILDTVTAENAEDVAVVLDAGSEYSALVESAFEAAEIPFYGGPDFVDAQDHRGFIQLLRCTVAGSDTRIGTVKPLLTCLGSTVDVEHDEKRLFEVDDPELEWLCEFCTRASTLTIGDALEAYEDRAACTLDAFREELERLGLAEEQLTEVVIDRLTFYLQTYDVPIDRENDGVLLADAKSASFVDRPVVFYLGLDENWTHDSPRRPWVDRDYEFERNIDQFQSLLQNGAEQYYLVQDTAGGSPVTPCLYFEELLADEFDRFSDLESIRHSRTFRPTHEGFEKESVDVSTKTVSTLSQSSLNTYANSPRDYFFGRLVDGPDKDYFAEGNLFHDFAEFVVNHPGFVDEDVIEEIAGVMLEETQAFHRDVDLGTRRTEYRIGLETIVEYLEAHAPSETDFLTPASGWGQNFFEDYFDRSVDSPVTERWFEDEDIGVKGKIDLIQSPISLLDFKSGRKKSASQVTKHAALEPPSDQPNFQALLYLTYYRHQQPDEQLEFTFFHFLETLDDVITGGGNLADCLTTIMYHPIPFDEFVQSRAVFEALCEEASNACNKTFSKSSYDVYRTVLDRHQIPRTRDADEMADSSFGQALTEQLIADVGDYKYVTKGCVQAFRFLCGYRTESYFAEDIDEFERFVDEQLEELNRYRRGDARFPVNGRAGEPNYRYVDHRDLILTDDRTIRGNEQTTGNTDEWTADDEREINGDRTDEPVDAAVRGANR
ncbi:PD-(D/E)XK nuclease family protein [Natronorubrum halophilum]|uniref:PD-(D/E)XK nuclease family protein n=1 Tax=Natronorubrum halophilum TaxID=1702106 RepID=UPI000EF6D8C8|nr:PD-(D/E)XK nuclease family protein [Natronorubrum halophilum]